MHNTILEYIKKWYGKGSIQDNKVSNTLDKLSDTAIHNRNTNHSKLFVPKMSALKKLKMNHGKLAGKIFIQSVQ